MRISLLAGSTVYPLAGQAGVDEHIHSSADGIEIEPECEVQEIRRVRAAHAVFIDRGNRIFRVKFATTRLFATPAEAEMYCLDYDADMPRAGTLIMEETGGPEGTETTLHLTDALLDPPSRRCAGRTALLDYTGTGSEIVAP